MLLEFDADQRLWQETVRDAVGKQCPPALVRGVAEDGVAVRARSGRPIIFLDQYRFQRKN